MPLQPARSDHLTIEINRAPVLTQWATVVAERLGFNHEEALALGKAVAGLNAQSKGVAAGDVSSHRGSPNPGAAS